MSACITDLVATLESNSSSVDSMKVVQIDDLCTSFTLDVIGKTMFSVDFESMLSGHPFAINFQTYMELAYQHAVNPMSRLLHPTSNFNRSRAAKYLHSFVDQIIANRISLRNSTSAQGKGAKDLLDLLLDAQDPASGVGLTSEEVKDQAITFVSHTLAFAIALIATHPHVGARIRQELDEVLGDGKTVDKYEQAAKLPYLTAVIKETLRMYPIVPELNRVLSEDTNIGGYDVPKGTRVLLGIIALHYNPQVWKNPTSFDPERFLQNEDNDVAGFFAHTPFGYGRRSCIGQNFAMLELRMALAALVRRFDFALLPLTSISVKQTITLKPGDGLKMTVWPRR